VCVCVCACVRAWLCVWCYNVNGLDILLILLHRFRRVHCDYFASFSSLYQERFTESLQELIS